MPLRQRDGQWHWRFQVDGVPYSGSTGLAATERNRTAAQREEARAHRDAIEGRTPDARIKAVPFAEAAAMFLDWCKQEHREKPRTAARVRTSFASLARFFGARPVRAITAGLIEDFKAWRRETGIREVTLRNDLCNLSKFFRYAKKHDWRRDNPVGEVDKPSGEAVRMHILTAEEERVYFEACRTGFDMPAAARVSRGGIHRGHDQPQAAQVADSQCKSGPLATHHHGPFPDLHDMARIVLSMGLRPNEEALALRWDHIDFAAGTLTVGKSKTEAGKRTLRMTPDVHALLRMRRASSKSEWVFPSPTKPGRHVVKLNNAHELALAHTGLAFVPYDLRHTFATRLATAGCPLPTLAKILGHAGLRVVAKYVHPQQVDMDRAMETYAAHREQERRIQEPVGGVQ